MDVSSTIHRAIRPVYEQYGALRTIYDGFRQYGTLRTHTTNFEQNNALRKYTLTPYNTVRFTYIIHDTIYCVLYIKYRNFPFIYANTL